MTINAMAEVIAKIKKEDMGPILNKLFEYHSKQYNESKELKKGNITKIDEEIFKVSF